jgi:hypothetical protein
MVMDREIRTEDLAWLAESLSKDEYHKTTTPEFFIQPNTVCKIYEDEDGPILAVRGSIDFKRSKDAGSKSLRLDIQYKDNLDHRRNMKAMITGFDILAKRSKENGFFEIVFDTNSPLLRKFCIRRLGFEELDEFQLRKVL